MPLDPVPDEQWVDTLLSIYTLPVCATTTARQSCTALSNAFYALATQHMPLLLRSILAKLKGLVESFEEYPNKSALLAPGTVAASRTPRRYLSTSTSTSTSTKLTIILLLVVVVDAVSLQIPSTTKHRCTRSRSSAC